MPVPQVGEFALGPRTSITGISFGRIVLQLVGCLLGGLGHSHAAPSRSAAARAGPRGRPLLTSALQAHSNTQTQVSLSLLWGPCTLVCTRFLLSPLSISEDGFDSICDFSLLPFHSFLCPWMWSVYLVGSSILLWVVFGGWLQVWSPPAEDERRSSLLCRLVTGSGYYRKVV